MKNIGGKGLILIMFIALIWVIWAVFHPAPIKVETAKAQRGELCLTVNAEGKTRVQERFIISAPVNGHLVRIELHRGDNINKNTVLARIEPLPLAPLDPRQKAEAIARVAAAKATKSQIETSVEHAQAESEQAQRELARIEKLAANGLISQQELERSQVMAKTTAKELEAAKFKDQVASAEIEQAQSALLSFEQAGSGQTTTVEVHSPIAGKVLKILEESERVITAGTPLIELSNPAKQEVVVDVLSIDAVKIVPGSLVFIENWGGTKPLQARVRLIEPSAFTKVSALGVEEQRVNVIIDFIDQAENLGDGFRVEARIVIWQNANVLKIPTSAIFREGKEWVVFIAKAGKACKHTVTIGHYNSSEVEIIKGLTVGISVILHPSNQLKDGVNISDL